MVELEEIEDKQESDQLYSLIENHYNYTSSQRAKYIIDNWITEKYNFVKVIPGEYKRALQALEEEKQKEILSSVNKFSEVVNG
jgi:glutamate synthase domain-containing protein 3